MDNMLVNYYYNKPTLKTTSKPQCCIIIHIYFLHMACLGVLLTWDGLTHIAAGQLGANSCRLGVVAGVTGLEQFCSTCPSSLSCDQGHVLLMATGRPHKHKQKHIKLLQTQAQNCTLHFYHTLWAKASNISKLRSRGREIHPPLQKGACKFTCQKAQLQEGVKNWGQ